MATAGEDSSSVSLDYVSTGCSCSPHSCAWAADGLVAFASNRTVSIYSPSSEDHKRVVCTLRGHTDRVNCVAWFTPSAASVGLAGGGSSSGEAEHQDGACCSELVSGSVDRTVIVWRIKRTHRADDGESLCVEMVQSQVLSHHSDVVVSVATCSVNGTEWIASSSADSTVCMWKRSGGGGGREQRYEFVQSLTCGRRSFVLDVSFGLLPVTGSPLLACAAEDMHIHLWALQAAAAPAAGGDEWRLVQHLAGHEDWVRTVEFAQRDRSSSSGEGTPTTGDLLLASGAQDSYVRVWRIVSDDPITDAAAMTAVSDGGNVVPEIRLRENSFSVGVHRFSATLDAILSGHEHWIYGVTWQPAVISNDDRGTVEQPLCLLSASMDKTLMVWRFDHDASVWLDESRMGDIGGNTLGFYGAAFSPCGQWIIGHGYQGAFHLWRYAAEARTWQPRVVASGHFGPVLDLAWSPDGCLLSVSKDQTCRLHAEWNRPALTPPASSTTTGTLASSWHEVARPQIHGYDLQCLAMTAPFQYACGADEKVIRVFDASALFLRNLSSIGGREVSSSSQAAALPLGATVPALGLSNKAVYGDSDAKGKRADEESEQFGAADVNRLPAFSATELCSPPYEEDLLQNTLWPETQKLYGHGYELFALASDGRHYLASACKASKAQHAAVLLWDTQSSAASSSWKLCGTLTYHGLTVTQLCFSNSGEWLLAVSRDRTWSLWRWDETSSGAPFTLAAATQKQSSVHQRIIWSCSWSPDDRVFATASRDKKVALWSNDATLLQQDTRMEAKALPPYHDCGQGWGVASALLELSDSATAVRFAPLIAGASTSTADAKYTLAIGQEDGAVLLASWCVSTQWSVVHRVTHSHCPVQTVHRLSWRPADSGQTEKRRHHQQLAVASGDHSVRILAFPNCLFAS